MLGVLITIVKMVSLARVIPEAALFAFGVLTLMIAVVLTFDPRVLWDLADEMREPSQKPLPRTSADSAAAAVNSLAGPPPPPEVQGTAQSALPPAPHQG
jgi:paraquat-inducible protein A